MITYVIDNDQYKKNRYCYAVKERQLDGQKTRFFCDKCKASTPLDVQELLVDLEGGSYFPDFLDCDSKKTFVSERVLNNWLHNNVTGFQYYRVYIDKILNKKLFERERIDYYYIAVNGFSDWDKANSDIEIIATCENCKWHKSRMKTDREDSKFTLDLNTWDGSDIFKTSYFGYVFCTDKIVRIAFKEKHSCVSFRHSKDLLNLKAMNIRSISEL